MSRVSIWPVGLILALAAAVVVPLDRADAQPPAASSSPLDLVKGLRDQGMSDLALEYLKDLETSPALPAAAKAMIPLEKAKCQLEAAEDEPDEAARGSLVAEATIGFREFLSRNPKHPRAAEAAIALARLKSIEAKTQLIRANRIDTSGEGPEKDKAVALQRAEAAKARPMFNEAAKLFKDGSDRLDAQVKQGNLDVATRKALEQESLDAELARGINKYSLGDTYKNSAAGELKIRADNLKEAKAIFNDLAKRPGSGRTGWIARAWAAECEFETDTALVGEKENKAILDSNQFEAEDGKRMVQFFQIRRAFLSFGDLKQLQAVQSQARAWLYKYGANRRARAEATAIRFYLATLLRLEALSINPLPKDYPKTPYNPGGTARAKLAEAERVYRVIIQSDNEYTDRATRHRFLVVRLLIGEAEKPPSDYKSFEECQMAAIIQISKMLDEDKSNAEEQVLKARRLKIVALLERARILANDKDNPADVADVLIQLVYFYELTDQPHQAAILGEYITRNVKMAGGKSSGAGAMSLNAYAMSTVKIPVGPGSEQSQKADRARAIRLARFIDQRYPNDPATDRARYRLGVLLYEDKDLLGAYEALIKVRAGYEGITTVRLYQGAIVSQLLIGKNSSLPDNDENRPQRVAILRRTLEDLDKLVPPSSAAEANVVRAYYAARVRLAMLLFLQPRIDKEGEKAKPGYVRALAVSQDLIVKLDTFTSLTTDKKLNADGWEAKLMAEDARTRAAYLHANDLYTEASAGQDPAKYEPVFQVLGPILTEMTAQGPFTEQLKVVLPVPKEDDQYGLQQRQRIDASAAGVDNIRREVIVLGLKARVRQGGDATQMIGLLTTKFGGSIEANIKVLELLAHDVATQMKELRKAGKPEQATALAAGFSKLLVEIAKDGNLSPQVLLFLGQAQIAVEDYPQAVATLKRIAAPTHPDAIRYDELARQLPALAAKVEDAKTEKEKQDAMDAKVDLERRLKGAEPERQSAIYYRGACLHLVRCYRQAGAAAGMPAGLGPFLACEELLLLVMGTKEKPGWAWTSMEFRKELAYLYEARGTADHNPAAAKDYFGKALQEWTVLYSIHKSRIDKGVPKDANGNDDNNTYIKYKNAFYDAFFDIQRCLVKANQKLLADPKFAPQLAKSIDSVAQKFLDVEKIMGGDLDEDVAARYTELLDETPALKAAYEKLGGKKFLNKPQP